jgi:hypothetical protein
MGDIAHDAVIVTAAGYAMRGEASGIASPDVAEFRDLMPERYRHLVFGPIPAAMNDYMTYVFAPDGSKEGWSDSDAVDELRERFISLFSETYEDGSSPFDIVHVRFGRDLAGAKVVFSNAEAHHGR